MKINLAKIKQYCERHAKKYPSLILSIVDCKSAATEYLQIRRNAVRRAEYHKYLTGELLLDLYIAQYIYHETAKQWDKSLADLYNAVAVLLCKISEYERGEKAWAKIRGELMRMRASKPNPFRVGIASKVDE